MSSICLQSEREQGNQEAKECKSCRLRCWEVQRANTRRITHLCCGIFSVHFYSSSSVKSHTFVWVCMNILSPNRSLYTMATLMLAFVVPGEKHLLGCLILTEPTMIASCHGIKEYFFPSLFSHLPPALPSSLPAGSRWHHVADHQHAGGRSRTHAKIHTSFKCGSWLMFLLRLLKNFKASLYLRKNLFTFTQN